MTDGGVLNGLGYFLSCCFRNPSLQVREQTLTFFQIGASTGLGLSEQKSGEVCADVGLSTWQVLPGGLGSGVRARRHLHLRAEYRGSRPGARVRGTSLGHPGAAPWSSRRTNVIPP